MTLLVFPDINVWLALAFSRHAHHARAKAWFYSLEEGTTLIFCRHTQLGFLRLLTTETVMGDNVKTQRAAWRVYDTFIQAGIQFKPEPYLVEEHFRRFARLDSASPKDWADSYLAAFAVAEGAKLATFDKALAATSKESILL